MGKTELFEFDPANGQTVGFRQGVRHYCLLEGLPARICHYRLQDKNVQNLYFLLSRIKKLYFSF